MALDLRAERRREHYRRRALGLAEALGEDIRRSLRSNFLSLALVGSVTRGDAVPGFSGLNLYLVVPRPRSTPRKPLTRAIEARARDFPEFYNRHGALVMIMLVSRRALTEARRPGTRGLLDSLTRHDLRTWGVTMAGEDLLGSIPEEPLDPRDLREILRRYVYQVGDFNPESFFGRMTLLKAVLHVARMDVLLHGRYVVDKGDVVKAFGRNHPEALAIPREAYLMRRDWGDHPGDPILFRDFQARARPWARTVAREHLP